MSKVLNFVNKYSGKLVDVTPTWGHPGQCVSLVQRFIIEELGVKAKARGNGEAWRTCLINEGLGLRVERKDLRRGDIIAWPGKLGHVAICLGGDEIFQQVGTKPPIDPKVSSARVGSIAYWDRVQGSPGLITRLKNFDDVIDKPSNKSNVEVAKEVIDGKWGVGSDRVNKLKKAGYDSSEIQKLVNEMLKPKEPTKPTLKSNETIAAEVLKGLWGNGADRVNRLTKAGYDAKAIQAIVNKGSASTKPPVNKPVEKPKPKTVRLSGKTRLFVSSGGTATYPQVPRKTYDHYTDLKSRTVSVVDENASRVRVRIPGFSPELIWINKSELK